MVRVPLGMPRPPQRHLVDRFGRVATNLRVSLTDRCNLRCGYCMPAEGLDWMPPAQQLDDEELFRLIAVAVRDLGVEEIRFTGGEPLLRSGLESLISRTVALRTWQGLPPRTAVTTNGLGLRHRARALHEAGLHRINISLDTLRPDRFLTLTRRARLTDVLEGIEAAREAGLSPVKINTVLMRGTNDDEAPDLLAWALERGLHLRFIEQMPLEPHGSWDRSSMVTTQEILDGLSARFRLTAQEPGHRGAAPAETWWAEPREGGPGGPVGIVGSVTRPFCGDCDRTRLTADGQVRSCLFATVETDLRKLLRDGADDETLARAWRTAMWHKAAGHGIDDPRFSRPQRPMSAIGG
ncbi:MAG: GTP 3',8-cyclase MoaA [Kineosporiaceae bacterium]